MQRAISKVFVGLVFRVSPIGSAGDSRALTNPANHDTSGAWMHHHFPCVKRWASFRREGRGARRAPTFAFRLSESLVQRVLGCHVSAAQMDVRRALLRTESFLSDSG